VCEGFILDWVEKVSDCPLISTCQGALLMVHDIDVLSLRSGTATHDASAALEM